MADTLRGDVPFDIDGETYVMRFGGGALLAMEEALGLPFAEVFDGFAELEKAGKSPPMKDIATVIRCGLARHHPDLSLPEAADLALYPATQNALARAVEAALPKAVEGGDAAEGNATKPRRGTGTKS